MSRWVEVVIVELITAVAAGCVFMARYALRSAWRSSSIGRHEMSTMAVIVGEALSLLLLAIGVRVPLWVFAVGFGALDVVLIYRIVLLVRAQERGMDHDR